MTSLFAPVEDPILTNNHLRVLCQIRKELSRCLLFMLGKEAQKRANGFFLFSLLCGGFPLLLLLLLLPTFSLPLSRRLFPFLQRRGGGGGGGGNRRRGYGRWFSLFFLPFPFLLHRAPSNVRFKLANEFFGIFSVLRFFQGQERHLVRGGHVFTGERAAVDWRSLQVARGCRRQHCGHAFEEHSRQIGRGQRSL